MSLKWYDFCTICKKEFDIIVEEFYLYHNNTYDTIIVCEKCLYAMGWASLEDFVKWSDLERRKDELRNQKNE